MAAELVDLTYRHEAMIDVLLGSPGVTSGELAAKFKMSKSHLSVVLNSEVFKKRLVERRAKEIAPMLVASLREKLNAVAGVSLEMMLDRLTVDGDKVPDRVLLSTARLALDSLGYGGEKVGPATNVAVVVQVPAKIEDSSAWVGAHGAGVVDV